MAQFNRSGELKISPGQNEDRVSLGVTDLLISPMGIGCWAWGERFYWGFGRGYTEDDTQAAFEASVQAGINFFDTAEFYGRGNSERLLGKFSSPTNVPLVLATKYMPFPWRLSKNQLLVALTSSLDRLGIEQVDLYQIHWPFPPIPIETWMYGLADAVELGLTRTIGVSNYNKDQMHSAHTVLAKRGIPLASNQVEYHLLNRNVETNGLLSMCHDFGITLIAYSPLAQGLLTGKYTADNPPKGIRGLRYRPSVFTKIQPLIRLLKEIGRDHDGKTPAQVAINWILCKGAVPIPGAKNALQAQENLGAMGWRLSENAVAALDKGSQDIYE